mgnify:CR=1 FL=1
MVSLRYIYGCVIYLNNVEVFRNGVSGDLSSSSVGLNAYTDLLYRQISLPVRVMGVESNYHRVCLWHDFDAVYQYYK